MRMLIIPKNKGACRATALALGHTVVCHTSSTVLLVARARGGSFVAPPRAVPVYQLSIGSKSAHERTLVTLSP
jgi:hypothetical protein